MAYICANEKNTKVSAVIFTKRPRWSLKRQYNKALILNCVRKYSPISRTRIRALTNIRLASITELARLLSREGYLCQAGVKDSRRGRKQSLLRLNARNGFAVGLEYGPEHVVAVLTDLEANVLARTRVAMRGCPARNMMIQSIIRLVSKMCGFAEREFSATADPPV